MFDFDEYHDRASATRTSRSPAFTYPALGLNGEAGEVAEHVKKMIRDDDGVLTEDRRQKLLKELGDVLWYLTALADDCGFSLYEVASTNIMKLESRKDRGVLHGSGDDR